MATRDHQKANREQKIMREDLQGTLRMARRDELGGKKAKKRAEKGKRYGLEAAPGIVDRSLVVKKRCRNRRKVIKDHI